MDRGAAPEPAGTEGAPLDRPRIALVLQGGGSLGAYQAGVYEAMSEAGLEPDWVAGVSIGGINAALIAGNPPSLRLSRLRDFWEAVTSRPVWPFPVEGEASRKAGHIWSAWLTTVLGQPGFFRPNLPSPWASPRGTRTATAFYDSAPLRDTLEPLIDFGLINGGGARMACGAVNVTNGNFAYFDSTETTIGLDHVIASGALPPALPMVRIGADHFWDGGLVSNTPLQHVLDNVGARDTLVFQVDLFSAKGALPRDMDEVLGRQKDIQFSSRTRLVTDTYRRAFHRDAILARLLARMDDGALSDEERKLKEELARLPAVTILELIYQQAPYEGQAKDYEFSAASMREHWQAGLRDGRETLAHADWLLTSPAVDGIAVHDIHEADG